VSQLPDRFILNMIIDGRKLAGAREALLKKKVDRFIKINRRRPSLLAIELSDDPGSRLYLKLKKAAAERIGIEFQPSSFVLRPSSFSRFDGIFIQHPPGYDKQKWQELANQIPPEKDVDCLTTKNLNLIKRGRPRFLPATVMAVIYCLTAALHLKRTVLPWEGLSFLEKNVVILGRSPILGLPLYHWLKTLGADVTLLHSQSKNIKQKTKTADILISSVGKPKIITGDMVKNGVIAIDCGSPIGDIDFASVSQEAAAITPVPGGVGPLTVISLMENVVESAYHASQESSANVNQKI